MNSQSPFTGNTRRSRPFSSWPSDIVDPITSLPLTVSPGEFETATSFASRLSARNGLPRLRTFCRDMGVPYVDLCNGDPEAIEKVAKLGGANPIPPLLYSPTLTEPGWFALGMERLKFTALLRSGGNICPLCIADDRRSDPRFGPFQRSTWQIGAFRRCRKHGVILERSQFDRKHADTHDFQQTLRPWKPSKVIHTDDRNTSLEDYLLRRLWTGVGESWVDQQAFHVVWLFSEVLGILLLHGPNVKPRERSAQELIQAGAIGFEVMKHGIQAVRTVLADIRDQAGADRGTYGKLYRPLIKCLGERRKDPAFNELRNMVREFILDNFWVSPGTSVLGEQCVETRIYTAKMASVAYDVPLTLLTRQLRKEGLLTGQQRNHKSDPNVLFQRSQIEAVVAEVGKLSSIAATRAVLGADRFVMERLCVEGLLTPHFDEDGGMPMYHRDEIVCLVLRLQDAVARVRKPGRHWRSITSAASRSHCSTAWIIRQVYDGRLELASKAPSPFKLGDFLVSMSKLKELLRSQPEGMVTAADAAKRLSADVRTIHALAAAGYLPSVMTMSRLANRSRRFIAIFDLESFAHKYIVLRALSGTRKAQYMNTLSFIEDHGISPILTHEGVKPVFERFAIERLAQLPGGELLARLLAIEGTRLSRNTMPPVKKIDSNIKGSQS